MKIGKVINLKDYSFIFNFIKQNKIIITAFILFISGFVLGIYTPEKFEGFKDFFNSVINDFFTIRNEGDILDISISSFSIYVNILIVVFII